MAVAATFTTRRTSFSTRYRFPREARFRSTSVAYFQFSADMANSRGFGARRTKGKLNLDLCWVVGEFLGTMNH